jgi:putative transposase
MPRGPRLLPEDGTFHVMIRGNNKKCTFYKDCEFRYFKKLILRYKKKFKFFLYHYTLMKNHLHFCIKATEKTNVSKMMQGLQLAYYHYHRKRYRYVGHL